VAAIVAAGNYSLALKSNGTVVAWGVNDSGQTNVPGGLNNVVAIAGNLGYCLALKNDGTVVAWGAAPSVPGGLNGVIAIAAGEHHSLALKSNGTVQEWGSNQSGEGVVPAGLSGVTAIAAGWNYSLALAAGGPQITPFSLGNPSWRNNRFTVSLQTQNGIVYIMEYKNAMSDSTWIPLPSVTGNGSVISLTDSSATNPKRFYRVRAQ